MMLMPWRRNKEPDIPPVPDDLRGRYPGRGLTGDPRMDLDRLYARITLCLENGTLDRTEIERWRECIRYVSTCVPYVNRRLRGW